MDLENYEDLIGQQEIDTEKKSLVLAAGERAVLTELDPALRRATAGIGWLFKGYEGEPLDLDVSVFLLDKKDQTREDSDFIFYNNLTGCNGAVEHSGDNRIGAGEGDDEAISLQLNEIPFDVLRVLFVISIYQGDELGQDLGGVTSAYLRIVNEETSREVLRVNLDDLSLSGTVLKIAELERIGPKWEFHALGEAASGGLHTLAEKYGIVVGEY